MLHDRNRRRGRKPAVVIDAKYIDQLHAIAEGVLRRDPDLSDELHGELARARVVRHERMPADIATIGNLVRYVDEKTGQEREVSIVFPEDADIAQGRISVLTPIGVALLGLREGASFEWRTRTGEVRALKVVRVSSVDRMVSPT